MQNMFRRHISLLLVVAMVLGIVCVPGIIPTTTAAESTQVNLLTNPGFETRNQIPGWNTSPNPATYAELSSDYVKDGAFSVQITGGGKWLWSDKVTGITAGETCVLSADVLADPTANGTAIVQAYIRFYDDADTKLSQTPAAELDLTEDKGTWQNVTVTGVAPSGATKADVLLVTTGATTGTVFFDNASFVKETASSKPGATEPTVLIDENFDDTTMNTSKGVPAGWQGDFAAADDGKTVSLDTAEKAGQSGASMMVVRDTTASGAMSPYYKVARVITAGKSYRVSVDYKAEAGKSIQFVVQTSNSSNNQYYNDVGAGEWVSRSYTFTAVADATYMQVVLGFNSATTGTVWYDNLKLEELPEKDPAIVIEDNFDDGVASWAAPNSTATISKSDDVAKDGSSMKIVKTGTGTGSFYITRYWQNIAFEAGKTYRLQVDFCGDIRFFWLFRNNSDIKSTGSQKIFQQIAEAGSSEEWKTVSIEFTAAEADTVATKIETTLDLRNSWEGTVYFDNLKIVDVAAEESSKPGGNCLTNASFNTYAAVPGWSNPSGEGMYPYTLQSAEQAKTGSYSMKLVDTMTNGGIQWLSDAHAAQAGEEYTATAQVYGAGYVQLALRFLKADGKMSSQVLEGVTASDSWTNITAVGTVPQDAIKVCVLVVTTGASTGTAYFDDVSLIKTKSLATETPIDPQAIVDETFDDTTINEEGHPANWQGHETGANLVTYTLDSSVRKGDSGYSLKVEKSHTATRTIYIDKQFEVQAGKTYRAEVDYYGAVTCQFYLQTFTSGYTTVDSQNTGDAGTAGQWKHLTNEFVASADADIIRIVIGLGGTTTGTVYFDNVRLIEVPSEESADVSIFTDDFEESTITSGMCPTNWQGTVDANVTYTLEIDAQGRSGKTLKQVKTGTSTRSLYVDIKNYPVVVGKTYRAEMDVFVVSDGTDTDIAESFQFYLQTYTDGHAARIDSQDVGRNAVEGQWVHLTNEIVATANASIVRVLFGLGGKAEGTVYIDNISLVEVAEQEDDGNLLRNPSFEEGAEYLGWSVNAPESTAITTERAKHGGSSIMTVDTNPSGGNQIWSEKVTVTAGKEYTAAGYVYDVAGDTDVQIYLRYFDASGTRVDQKFASIRTAAGNWEELTVTLAVPTNAVKADVLVCTTSSTQGAVFFDSISLTMNEDETGSTPGGNTPGGTVDPNAIVDETFDNTTINNKGVPTGWQGTVDSKVTYTLDSAIKAGTSGSSLKLYKVDGTTTTRTIYIEKTFTVTAGKTYRAELDYYGSVECQFYLQTYNGNTLVDSQNSGVKGISGQWAHLTNEFVASESATKIRIVIGLGGSVCGTVYFDNIKLKETETKEEEEETDPNIRLQDKFNDTVIGADGLPSNWTGNAAGGEYTMEDGNIYLQMTKAEGVTTSRTIYKEWTMDIKEGQKYRLEMDYYGGPSCQFYLQLLSGGMVVQSQDEGKMGKENAWIHLTNVFTATQDAQKIRITIGLGGVVTGTVGFDNIRLVEVKADGNVEIYNETFDNAALQANTIPKGWQGGAQADTRFKLADNGSYIQITKDKATEEPTTLVLEAPLTITAGETYKAMIDFLGKARGAIQIDLLSGTALVQSVRKSALGNADLWGGLAAEITAEKNADKVRITVSLDAAAIGSYGFDNFKFVYVEPLDLENMITQIQNPSFEETPVGTNLFPGWGATSDDTCFSISDEQASDGKFSLKVVDELPDAGCNITSSRIEVIPNASYVASVDVYGDANAQIYIRFMNKYGVIISDGSATMQKEDGFWYTMKAQTNAPADAVYAVILLATTRLTTGRVYFDNVKVEMTISDSTEGGSTPNVTPEGGWQLIETEHPRLFYTAETLKDVQAFAKDKNNNVFGYSGNGNYRKLINGAEAYLIEENLRINHLETLVEYDMINFPDPNYMEAHQQVPQGYTGGFSYPYMSAYGSELKTRLQTLALAYNLTGDTRYADRAIDISLKMCNWELWTEKSHWVDNVGTNTGQDTCYFVNGAATVYDMCYDRMTEQQRKTLKNAIVTKGLDMFMEDTGIVVNHNYYLSRTSALIIGACAIAESVDEVEDYLTRGYNYAKWYLDNLYTSGDQEGFMYNSHQIEELVESLDNLRRVTGNDELVTHEYFSNLLVDWILYFMAPGSGALMPVSDSPFGKYFFTTLSILNKEMGNEKAGFILYYGQMSGTPFKNLLYTSKDPKIADAETVYKAVAHIEKLGYGGLRSGWDADDIFLSLISNTSDLHHNHYDQNSIIFSADGNLLVSDAGYADTSGGSAGVFGRYHGHSTIFVDGEPQQEKGYGTLSTIINSNLYGHLMGSAPDAYGVDRYGKVLDQFDRHAIMINHGDRPYFIIFDELAASHDHTFTWNMYTGGWNGLEIEGQTVEGITSVKGNKVAVSTSGGMLFTEFVAGEPLKISTFMHDGGGPNLQVDSEKGKNAEFMTILTKNYGDSANDEYSFIPLLDKPDMVEYKTSSSNPVITKSVTVQSVPLYFFRGDKVGDYIKLPFVAEESGNFELIMKTCTNYNYGTYKVYIDDKYVTTYDGCSIKTELNYLSLGQMDITAGEHTLKLELVGTSSLVGGMLISVSSIIFSSGQTLGSSPIYAEEVYDTDKVLGAKIFHTEYNSDIVLMNRSTGSFTAGGVTTNAKHASIIGLMADGYMEGFAATDATSMVYNGTTLLKATDSVSVAADFRGTATYEVTTETAQTVKLYAGSGILGATVDGKKVDITTENGMAVLSLSAGTHTVVLKMTQTTKIEYLDNGTIISTTYDSNGNVIRQHTKNTDGTELLVENGKVIINAYIDEDTFLLVREELAEDGTFTTTYYDVTNNIDRVVIEHPDGRRTEIDYQSDGTIVTTVWDENGIAVEGIIQYEDGSVTKAEYKNDATVTTKYDAEGNILDTVTAYKDGRREEVVYNADGSVITTKYAKGGKLASVHTKNADGTAVLKEYLSDGGICTTKFDAQGKVIEKITNYKNGAYIIDGFVPKIISGDGQSYSGSGTLIFVSDDDFVNFKYVTIDGEEIDPSWYIVEKGSIKVTLTEELLSVLGNGTFTVGIVSTHGTATASFTIGGNQMSVWLWIAIAAVVAAGGATAAIILIRKKKNKGEAEQDETVNA